MAIRTLVQVYPALSTKEQNSSQILLQTTLPVTQFDTKLKRLVEDMLDTLKAARNPEGVGLAAPQLGINKSVFVMQTNPNTRKHKPQYAAFINPEITYSLPKTAAEPESPELNTIANKKILEGCLSISNIWGYPQRAKVITIRYQDLSGKKCIQKLRGFPAVIAQHEVDHLHGILFTQRVLEQKGKLYQLEEDENGKTVLIPLDL